MAKWLLGLWLAILLVDVSIQSFCAETKSKKG